MGRGLYLCDRGWSDRFIPAITQIVGPRLLVPAPPEIDGRTATDLLVWQARDLAIAARVRRPGYAVRYGTQFTLRARRANGRPTELAKIMAGFADWLFYGHAAPVPAGGVVPPSADAFARWMIIDLDVFRRQYRVSLTPDFAWLHGGSTGLPGLVVGQQDNTDQETQFLAFDAAAFPATPPLLIASSHPLPGRDTGGGEQRTLAY